MRFVVRRTSYYENERQPCPEAILGDYTRIDWRTVTTAELPERVKRTWFTEGKNHRDVDGHAVREFDGRAWFIDLDGLEALMAFLQKYGPVIIEPFWQNHTMFSIEIYDDYRE